MDRKIYIFETASSLVYAKDKGHDRLIKIAETEEDNPCPEIERFLKSSTEFTGMNGKYALLCLRETDIPLSSIFKELDEMGVQKIGSDKWYFVEPEEVLAIVTNLENQGENNGK